MFRSSSYRRSRWKTCTDILIIVAIIAAVIGLFCFSVKYELNIFGENREYVSPGVYRTKVEGGYLYETNGYHYDRYHGKNIEFVPDQQ
jgi:hypothetical protein